MWQKGSGGVEKFEFPIGGYGMQYGERNGIVIVGEIQKGKLLPVTLELLFAGRKLAQQMESSLSVVLLGQEVRQEAARLRNYQIDEVLYMEHACLKENTATLHGSALCGLLKEKKPKAVLIGATTFGRVLGAVTAYELGTELVTDASDLCYEQKNERILITRPAFDGKMMAEFALSDGQINVISIRPGMMGKAPYLDTESGVIKEIKPKWLEQTTDLLKQEGIVPRKGREIHLEDASMIISGGRGMKGKDGFQLLEKLAERLGGEVGSTRPCVDAGWTVPDQQIGQSGIAVKPKLYMAFGISGAIQHMTAIDAEYMIAVNQNPKAAIFKDCDYGVVGDAKQILTSMIKQMDSIEEIF